MKTLAQDTFSRPSTLIMEDNDMNQTQTKKLNLRLANLDCDHDAAAIKHGLEASPGVYDLKIYPKSAKISLSFDPDMTSPEVIKQKLERLGFPPQAGYSMPQQPKLWNNPQVLASLVSGVLLLAGWLIGMRRGMAEIVSTVLYAAAILTGGYYFGREAIEELLFERKIGIELLMSTAAVAAAIMGQVAEGAMLAFLYSISEVAEGYTEEKTRSAIKALMDLAPKMALVQREGQEIEIPVEELDVGEVFIVKPGESVPTDGDVLKGASSVNQAPVTGESMPVEKLPSDAVFAGTINGEGTLEIHATKTFEDNTLSRIIRMVEEAQERKGKSQRFIERFGARYSPAILFVSILIAIIPPLATNADWVRWITRATVFIVAAAPCALVISIPITLVASLGTGARQGVLIKGGLFIEELAKVKVVALDKTGTLTRGEPEVTDVISPDADPEHFLALAAGVELHSEHPLARAIARHAREQGVTPLESSQFHALTGAGATAQVNGRILYVGSPDLFKSTLGIPLTEVQDTVQRLQEEGKTVVVVGDDDTPFGLIAIRDNIRPNARQAIDALYRVGVEKIVMLTGDNQRTARVIGHELGIDTVYADLKPEDKVRKVRELAELYGHVAMVGDGINDAPALAAATVGIAMGAAGTDVALETADVALMADDLEKLAYALRLAKRNQSVIHQNLALSALVIGTLIIGAVVGTFTLPIAVLGHEISEFVVIGSGLRMLRSE